MIRVETFLLNALYHNFFKKSTVNLRKFQKVVLFVFNNKSFLKTIFKFKTDFFALSVLLFKKYCYKMLNIGSDSVNLVRIFTSGAVINFFLVILGGLLGLLFKKGIPEKVKTTLMSGMALCVMYIGITGFFEEGADIIVIILSFALGAVIGELIDLDRLINRLGVRIEKRFSKSSDSKIAEGFVTATLLFCVGAMTVVGSIDSGISGDNSTLYSKSIIDCVAGMTLTTTLGAGVILACIPVLLIEGGLTLLAVFVEPVLTPEIITQMSVIGSALIVALSLNMLGLTKIKVMNYLPCIFLPLLLCFIL